MITFAALGCGGIQDLEEAEDTLIGAEETFARPEVARVVVGNAGCTATLIRSNVAVTAAHCVDFASHPDGTGEAGWLYVYGGPGRVDRFAVSGYVSFGSEVGDDDVALIRLADPVPTLVAAAATLADRDPANGESVTSYGFGCTDRATHAESGIKRRVTYAYSAGRVLCPGDSGGPGFLGVDGPLSLVHSGYWIQSGLDIHAKVSSVRARVDAQLGVWSPSSPVPPPAPSPPPSAPTPPSDPNACAALASSGGVLQEDGNCSTLGGDPRYLRAADGGLDGYVWTGTTNKPAAANFVELEAILSSPGAYRVEAYLGAGAGSTHRAAYRVEHARGSDTVVVDQSTADGFVELGYFELDSAGTVRLGDNTGEAGTLRRRVAFDAIRFTRVSNKPCGRLALASGISTANLRPYPSTEISAIGSVRSGAVADRLATVTGERIRGDARWHRVRVAGQIGYLSATIARCLD